ncbi:glycosyl hydrolase family 95 catalytic domain-containing protein, partial [Robinsoniella peoriensis]|uniref:glycosyl hydrolase family 95 catalytic domain-containing protein n=1 Tax=Robinsoniella peoriensis TaxID=180332 RepID=UPI003751CCBF
FDVSFPVDNAENVANNGLGKSVTYKAEGNTLVTAGQMQDNQLKMNSMLKVVTEGQVNPGSDNQSLHVSDASSVVIYVSADTDYKDSYPKYRTGESDEELAASVKATVEKAAGKNYDQVKADHIADYTNIFDRVDLDLGQGVSSKPTDELLAAYKANTATPEERSQLEVILYQYGRFMTIESSREGDLPANLQGVWQNRVGDANRVPWGSDYHMNVNLQMNYWPTYSANMAECAKPLIEYVDGLREPGRVTAKDYFGIESTEENPENGFTAHTQNTPFGWTCPGWAFSWGWSPAAVPWILQNCWEYYEYTGDVEYMRDKLYPMLKEEAKLYDQILTDSGVEITKPNGEKSTRLVSVPTYSPEHGPRTLGNAYEQELIWQLYEDAIIGAKILGEDEALIQKWQDTQDRLAPIEIGESGQIKEWYDETTLGSIGERGHRHMSHLLGLFPGDLISVDNDQYMDAAIVSLKDRGMKSTGWGMGQRINSWARTGQGNSAYDLVKTLFNDGINPNLFDSHAPFQIDGNFGYTSGVNEMLMQSNMGYINVLPALPDAWSSGSVKGIVARGNFETDINWEDGKATSVKILSKNGGDCAVQYTGISQANVVDSNGKQVEFTKLSRDRIQFVSTQGERYTITNFPELAKGPENLEAVYTGAAGVELTWDKAASETATYNVYRKEDGSYEKVAEGLTKANYTDKTAVKDITKVRYKITSVENGVESLYSETVSALDITVRGMVDDTDSRIEYSSRWTIYKDAAHYGGGIHFVETSSADDTISFVFSGKGIRVYATKNATWGIMDVYIDGVKADSIDFYDPTPQGLKQQMVYEKAGLEDTKHTIKLVGTGTRNPASTGTKLEFDAFQVLGDQHTITFESNKEGEGNLPESITEYEGSAITLPECGITIDGMTFAGWSDGETTYAAGSKYRIEKSDVTLTALWEETSNKIASNKMTAVADSEENAGTDGPASNAVDGNESTIWHSAYSHQPMPDIENGINNSFTITLDKLYQINKLEYVTRSQENGRILGYDLYYSTTEDGDDFQKIEGGSGEWANNVNKKIAKFTPVSAKRIQIRATKTAGTPANDFISAAEFYLYETGQTVTDPTAVTGVRLTPNEVTLVEETTATLTAAVIPSNATNKNVTWSSSDEEVATVVNGVVNALKPGNATITVTTADGNKTAQCAVTVTEKEVIPVSAITVSPKDATVKTGASVTLTGEIQPENASNQNMIWTSDNEGVATVAGGVVTGVAEGTATITVTSAENDTIRDTATITVENGEPEIVEVESVSVEPAALSLTEEETRNLAHTITPSNATNQNVSWSSDNEAVATVSQAGVVTAIKEGTANITVTTESNNKTATCIVTVTRKGIAVAGVKISSSALELKSGASETLTAAVQPENATNQNVSWTSNNEAVATVDGGIVKAVADGKATITVTTEEGGFTATCEVTVKSEPDPEIIKVTGVTLDEQAINIEVGKTAVIKESVQPENATNKNVTWDSNNKTVASVDKGKITALKEGIAEIIVTTADGNKTATCTVNVIPKQIPVESIKINPSSAAMQTGTKATLRVGYTPENATNKAVVWATDNEAVASVSNEGVVTAKAAGTANITATTVDGQKSSSCTVIVTEAPKPTPDPEVKEYTVIFDTDGGYVLPAEIKVQEGKPYGNLPTPKKGSYKFLGWYLGNTQVKSTDICKGDVTLKAKWKLMEPGRVTGVKASKQTTNSIKISWKKETGAKSYIVSSYNYSKKKWEKIATTKKTSYVDKKKKAATKYKYRVTAVNKAGSGSASKSMITATQPVKPTISLKQSGKKVKLSWNKFKADKIEIFMKTGNGKYKKISTKPGKNTAYTKTKLKKGTSYRFRIRGYMERGEKVYGAYSASKRITIK